MEVARSSETSVYNKPTRRHTPEDGLFGVPSIATMFSIVFILLFSFYTPLHVSALMGHLHVEHTQSLMEAITHTADLFLGYTIYTHISLGFLICYTLFLYLELKLIIMY
jgi:hypothetical protein